MSAGAVPAGGEGYRARLFGRIHPAVRLRQETPGIAAVLGNETVPILMLSSRSAQSAMPASSAHRP